MPWWPGFRPGPGSSLIRTVGLSAPMPHHAPGLRIGWDVQGFHAGGLTHPNRQFTASPSQPHLAACLQFSKFRIVWFLPLVSQGLLIFLLQFGLGPQADGWASCPPCLIVCLLLYDCAKSFPAEVRGSDGLLYRFLRRSQLPSCLQPGVMAYPVLAPGISVWVPQRLEHRVTAPEPGAGA